MKTIDLINKFRKSGRKVTPQRLAIFKTLEGNKTHPTADEIYRVIVKHYPTITLATIYQTLKILRDDGEIKELAIVRDKRHYDPNTTPHHHAVCKICGSVRDIKETPEIDVSMPEKEAGSFHFTAYQIAFYGTCEQCRHE